jgi:AcrR family transcriptional regulator
VTAALELFWSRGYERTSLAEVCRAAEVNPGSLYYFFPSKESLLESTLDRLLETIEEGLLHPAWEGVTDPIERIFALLDAYRRGLEASAFTYGCPVGSMALEWREPPEGVRRRLAANFDAWTSAVRQCLEAASDRLPPGTDLDRLATFVLTTMEGGVMLARTHRHAAAFDRSVAALRDYSDRLLDRRGGGSAHP